MATSLRQHANSEQPWLGNACPSPLLRLDAHNRTSPAQTFHTRGCMYQRRGGNVRAIAVFVKTAIRSLQRCIRQRKPPDARKIERSLLSSAPGLVGGTEFSTVRFRGDRAKAAKLYEGADALTPEDIAETIHWIATLPPRVNVNAIELMPVTQAFGPLVVHREDRPAEILERS